MYRKEDAIKRGWKTVASKVEWWPSVPEAKWKKGLQEGGNDQLC